MPDDSFVPPPPLPRPPVHGWMWVVCGLGMIPVCAILGAMSVAGSSADPSGAAGVGCFVGMLLGLPMIGGLALASRFISGNAGRIFGAVAFAMLLVIGLGGVAFAGCMCMLSQGSFH